MPCSAEPLAPADGTVGGCPPEAKAAGKASGEADVGTGRGKGSAAVRLYKPCIDEHSSDRDAQEWEGVNIQPTSPPGCPWHGA